MLLMDVAEVHSEGAKRLESETREQFPKLVVRSGPAPKIARWGFRLLPHFAPERVWEKRMNT